MLNINEFKWNELGSIQLLPEGHELKPAVLLFEKIEDEAVNAQVQKLLDKKKENEANAWQAPAPKKY